MTPKTGLATALVAAIVAALVSVAILLVVYRTAPGVVDVCESTGTRGLTDNDYLRRLAVLGRDDRGGAMTMFFATEMAGL